MLAYFSAILPWILWFPFRLLLPRGPYEFDHGPANTMGSFFALLPHYTRFFYAIGVAGLGGAFYAQHSGFGWPAWCLLLAAADALLFNGFLVFFYESYLAARYPRSWNFNEPPHPSNYTAGKYAWVMALGFSAVILLLVGAAGVAWRQWV